MIVDSEGVNIALGSSIDLLFDVLHQQSTEFCSPVVVMDKYYGRKAELPSVSVLASNNITAMGTIMFEVQINY